jgi:hypothetical protein
LFDGGGAGATGGEITHYEKRHYDLCPGKLLLIAAMAHPKFSTQLAIKPTSVSRLKSIPYVMAVTAQHHELF